MNISAAYTWGLALGLKKNLFWQKKKSHFEHSDLEGLVVHHGKNT